MRRRAAGVGRRACTAWLGRGWGNPVGTTPNLGPLWIALKGGSVTSCTADVGVDPRGGWLLTQQTAPAVGPPTGTGFAPPQSAHPFTLAATPSPGAGPVAARERNTHPLGCPSRARSDAGTGTRRRVALGFRGCVLGLGGARSVVRTRRGPTAATRGPPGPGRAVRPHVGRSWRHSRRCLRQSNRAAIGIRSARRMGSRPRRVGGRKSSASWISGARYSKFRIWLTRARVT